MHKVRLKNANVDVGILALVLSFALTAGCARLDVPTSVQATASGIINGEAVDGKDVIVASTVNIYYVNGRGVQGFCTGTVIGERSILTAAHCLAMGAEQLAVEIPEFAKMLNVGFGLKVIQNRGEAGVELIAVDSVTYPSAFHMESLAAAQRGGDIFDVAVLHLAQRIPGSARAVALLEDVSVLTAGTHLTIAGYGKTATSPLSVKAVGLNKVDISIDNSSVNPNQFLYRVAREQGPCLGDSGGPAYWIGPQGQVLLAGVNSWSDESCATFGAYTSVPVILDWIRAAIN